MTLTVVLPLERPAWSAAAAAVGYCGLQPASMYPGERGRRIEGLRRGWLQRLTANRVSVQSTTLEGEGMESRNIMGGNEIGQPAARSSLAVDCGKGLTVYFTSS